MPPITVQCDECGVLIDGLIEAGTMPNGDAFMMTGGFELYETGVSCDECVEGERGPEYDGEI
jgi:hypothetical protein